MRSTAPAASSGTRAEAQTIAWLYKTKPLLGEPATEAAVRARIGDAAMVHLATHGYFHPGWP